MPLWFNILALLAPALVLAVFITSVVCRHRIQHEYRTDRRRRLAADMFLHDLTTHRTTRSTP